MDYAGITVLLDTYADEVSSLDDASAADALNAKSVTRAKPEAWVRLRTLYGSGAWTPEEVETMVSALTAAAASNPVVARVLGWIQEIGPDTGIDVANTATQAQIQALATAGVLTQTQADKLLAMAIETITVPTYFGRPLEAEDIRIGRL